VAPGFESQRSHHLLSISYSGIAKAVLMGFAVGRVRKRGDSVVTGPHSDLLWSSLSGYASPSQTKTEATARLCSGGALAVGAGGAPDVFRFRCLPGRPGGVYAAGSPQISDGQWCLARSVGSRQSRRSGTPPGIPFPAFYRTTWQ